ncbi:MAG: cation:proton antiporter [Euryarchaeota archaeon]|nr:cation:proton antiporter [Euryarchaeota archaeon]
MSIKSATIAVVVLITYIAFEWPILQGILLGAIIGGTSSPIVISITSQLKAREEVSLVLSIESIFTDILCIVVAIASIEMLVARQATSLSLAAHSILSAFSIGAMVGLIGGIIWLYILSRIRGKPLSYMLSLAMLFFIYAGTEYVKGSGAIGALLFGLVLGNSKEISRMLRIKEELVIDDIIRKFEVEVSFFIRTFFFVYLGLIINIKDIISIGYGILLVIGVVALRPLAVRLSAIRSAFTKREIFLMSIMVPRGLAAAVLASLPLSYGYGAAKMFPELVFTVIVGTIIFCSIGVFLSRKIPEPTEGLAILPSSKN